MADDFTKEFLSESDNGRPIKVAAVVTPGTLIHTADNAAKDEVYLYAVNNDTADRLVTIEFGGVTDPDDLILQTIPFRAGKFWIVAGQPLSGALEVRAYADVANVVNIVGFVNRIVQT